MSESLLPRPITLAHAAITLTCVGLLAGGYVLIDAMQMARKLHGLHSEYQNYTLAVQHFYEKYQQLPGDFNGATDLWGIAGGNGHDKTCFKTNVRMLDDPKRTCDGNGDGILRLRDSVRDKSAPEWWHAWQHLVNAEMIPSPKQPFAGVADGFPRGATIGFNVPGSRYFTGAGFTFMSLPTKPASDWFAGDYLGFAVGSDDTRNAKGDAIETRNGFLTPGIAQVYDTKFDDGSPAYGRVRSYTDVAGCLNAEAHHFNPQGSHYNVGYKLHVCPLFLSINDPGETDPLTIHDERTLPFAKPY